MKFINIKDLFKILITRLYSNVIFNQYSIIKYLSNERYNTHVKSCI